MISFELSRNGKRLAMAGVPGFAVVSAIFTWVRRQSRFNPKKRDEELSFDLGARIGDVFVLRVLDVESADEPKRPPVRNHRDAIETAATAPRPTANC